jgi:hypothetical protein
MAGCPSQGHQQARPYRTTRGTRGNHQWSQQDVLTEGINSLGAGLGLASPTQYGLPQTAGRPVRAQGSPLADRKGALLILNTFRNCHGRRSKIVVNGRNGERTPAADWHGGQLENETLPSGKATPVSVHELLPSPKLADGAEPAD